MGATSPRLPVRFRRPAPDVALLLGVTALVVAATLLSAYREPAQPAARTALDWALVLSVCGSPLLWHRHPVGTCAYVLAATGAYYVLSPTDGPLIVVLMLALYGVAAAGRRRAAVVLSSVTVIGSGLGGLAGNEDVNGVALTMMTGWVVALVALGFARHGRREYLREAERRGAEEALRRATEERLRIARELHDVIGHTVSVINVQAGTALHRIRRDPDQAGAALGVIKEVSGAALREVRATLGVLRQADEEAPTAPAGGLDRIGELVRHARLAGLDATLDVEGEPRPLPADVDLAAYRVLQESVTNVIRHAAARTLRVRVGYGATDVRLEVGDDGRGGPVTGDGGGVRGMRERAWALGGELAAGPAPGGGFRVRASLPYGDGHR